ncbi:hypothetical protein PPACK8108_LOCUS20976 [Phakopsora pachyrhizi]|uniref:Piwi domain-containing protein n=1 Tax=Phakopsora pachyrhizi TaxID=170000 RepID=A0AAV0BJ38_PHAPC|nr:hypothetical protein PPACK8108_LOCUS20976 [Phakopsora pachyrhizi]
MEKIVQQEKKKGSGLGVVPMMPIGQANLNGTSCCTRYFALRDETNHTVDDTQNIENSVCSASQRATKSVGIATPPYYANLVATWAKKWAISDENGSTVFTTNSGALTSGERHCEFDYFKNKINKMNEKVKLISHQMWGLEKKRNKGGMVKKKESSKQQQLDLSMSLTFRIFFYSEQLIS